MENQKPNIPQLFSRAIALHKAGNLKDAEAIYRAILADDPQHANTLRLLGTAHLQQEDYEEGIRLVRISLEINPYQPEAHYNLGNALSAVKRYDEALATFGQALALKPDYAEAYNNRGNIFEELKRYDEALENYDKAATLKPDYSEAHNNRGVTLQGLKRYDEALASYDKAIALKPDYTEAYNNRGITLQEMKRYDEALANYAKAIALKPDYAEAYNNHGVTLQQMMRYNEALASYDKAIALKPDYAEAYNNRGISLWKLKRYDEMLVNYEKAIILNPDYAEAYNNRGLILQELTRYDEALASFDKALALARNMPYLYGKLLHTKMHLCKWQGLEVSFQRLAEYISAGKLAATPFPVIATPLSLALQKQCAEMAVLDLFPPSATPLWKGEKYSHDKIRIGYFSSDFNARHPMSSLLAEFFELHDHSKFEIAAFSFLRPVNDAIQERLRKTFDHFIDVRDQSELEIAALARSMEIDIAVDLNGFTTHSRTGIFALRPAPVQVSYMGYPGTMGANYIDYLIADPTVIPEEHKQYYTEKIVHLPHTYWVVDSTRKISENHFTRQEMGLPEHGFVFCCFNGTFKITPDVFGIWMRLLRQIDGSVLWLFESNLTAAQNLRAEAEARGIPAHRLVFAKRMDRNDHLARHRLADLFLDTFYCNAHTTASDALWEGLPLLTCLGETFASRVAASLLNAANIPELITHSHAQYEALAFELATNPQKLSALRDKLAQNRTTCPLFNTKLFTQYFEAAYVAMWQQSQIGARGLPS